MRSRGTRWSHDDAGPDEIAERLRVLSDPTHLTILSRLAHAPVAVSGLARTLHIAHPTSSMHLRRRNEAGFAAVARRGARSVCSAPTTTVGDLMIQVTERLPRAMRA